MVILAVVAAALWSGDIVERSLLGVSGDLQIARVRQWLTVATLPGILLSALLTTLLVVEDRIGLLMLWQTMGQALDLALTYILVFLLGWGITGALIANLVVQSASIPVTGIWLKSAGAEGRLRIGWRSLGRAFDIALQQHLVTPFANLFKRGENLLLAYLLDIRAVGYSSMATGLYDLVIEIRRTMM